MVGKKQLAAFRRILSRQIELLEAQRERAEELKNAVFAREVDDLSECLSRFNTLTDECNRMELKRHELFQAMSTGLGLREANFRTFIYALPENHRSEFTELRRRMMTAVYGLQSIMLQVNRYLISSLKTTKAVFDELFPEIRGTIYSKQGTSTRKDQVPLLVNERL